MTSGALDPHVHLGRRACTARRSGAIVALAVVAGLWLAVGTAPAGELAPSGIAVHPLEIPAGGKPGFTLMPGTQTGIQFTNELLPGPEAANHNLLNGSGLALGDVDGDGWCDLFFCNLTGSSRLYRNLGGWKFGDITEAAGLANTNWLARGAVLVDVDGSGSLDLLVSFSGKGVRLFLNDGQGHFRDAQAAELVDETGSMSLALGDLNSDGWLDLYVANYGENTVRSGLKISTRMVGGREQVVGRYRNRLKIIDGKLIEYGEPGALYFNDGRGRFIKASWTDGTFIDETGAPLKESPWELGFTAVIRDINQDGHPDIYVCNDFQDPDRFWLGDGRGKFHAPPRETLRSVPNFSMTADFADIDGDAQDDFIVTDMLSRYHDLRMRQLQPASPPPSFTRERAWDRPQVRRNFLFLNRGDGTYADIAQYAGVATSDWSWSVAFIDVDLDGWQDILVGTGHYYDTQDLDAIEKNKVTSQVGRTDGALALTDFPSLLTPNVAFRNLGGCRFEECAKTWGFDSVQVSHSIALADLDKDGDLDVVVNCLRTPALVYRNNSSAPRVAVRLRGAAPNTSGIGARLSLAGGAVPVQTQEMTSGSRFLAGDDCQRTFAAGQGDGRMTLEVTWRSGRRSVVSNVKANCLYEIDEAAGTAPAPKPKADSVASLFEDVTASLAHRHVESDWDDFGRQPLLPRRLSRLGPGVVFTDVDGDGREDLVVGASRGAPLGVYFNAGGGTWKPGGAPLTQPMPDDTAGLAVASLRDGVRSLLVGLSNYETSKPDAPAVLRFDAAGTNITPGAPLPSMASAPGSVCVADVDGDGDLDVFLGGRLLPGKYPESASSRLFLNEAGELTPAPGADEQFASLGLVTSALFTDLTADGFTELVVTLEWGTVRLFLNERGRFRPWDVELAPPLASSPHGPFKTVTKLSELTGLWMCAAAADFDSDGRQDLVLGNWGLNSSYNQVTPHGPWFLYHGDLNQDGTVQMLETYQEASTKRVLPWRDLLFTEKGLPWLRARFPTHLSYSKADVAAILGDHLSKARVVSAECLASIMLLNRGGHFVPALLPGEAQWSPAVGLVAADLNGDGCEDLFVAQNFFGVRPEDGRLDAGRGLLLRGNGKGEFSPVPGQTSGLRIYGEQRGCAVADYDQDGRPDLVVTQNNDETRLFRNTGAKPGLRVQVRGPAGNPEGIGAVLRMETGGGPTPAREIQAGSGGWSQSSPVQVLPMTQGLSALVIKWPGGNVTRTEIPPDAKSVTVDLRGSAHQAQ